jgi:hypothetical protein
LGQQAAKALQAGDLALAGMLLDELILNHLLDSKIIKDC